MSHFVGLCFGESWENNLEYYYEGLEAEPYIYYTKSEAIEQAKDEFLQNFTFAEKMLASDSLSEKDFKQYSEIVKKGCSITDDEAWNIAKDWGYEIDKDENLISTYNPDSKWDWYSVGGRWSGFLPLKELDSEGNHFTTNEALVREIDWEYLLNEKFPPFCYVDENGEWFEKGEMGWFGFVADEQPEDEWKTQFRDYLRTLDSDCLVTVIDFHI